MRILQPFYSFSIVSGTEWRSYFDTLGVIYHITWKKIYPITSETFGIKHTFVGVFSSVTWEVTPGATYQYLFGSKRGWVSREMSPTVVFLDTVVFMISVERGDI